MPRVGSCVRIRFIRHFGYALLSEVMGVCESNSIMWYSVPNLMGYKKPERREPVKVG